MADHHQLLIPIDIRGIRSSGEKNFLTSVDAHAKFVGYAYPQTVRIVAHVIFNTSKNSGVYCSPLNLLKCSSAFSYPGALRTTYSKCSIASGIFPCSARIAAAR